MLTCIMHAPNQADIMHWFAPMQHANDWLKKQLEIEDVTLSIHPQQKLPEKLTEAAPVLRTSCLRIAALAPVFAVLADRGVVGQTTAVIDVNLEPVTCSISSQQVAWLKVFTQTLPTVLAAQGRLAPYHHNKHPS